MSPLLVNRTENHSDNRKAQSLSPPVVNLDTVSQPSPADLPTTKVNQQDAAAQPVKNLQLITQVSQLQGKIVWRNVVYLLLLHFAAQYGLAMVLRGKVQWQTLIFACLVHLMAGLGVTAGVHRYWTHRCFKATLPLQIVLAFCNTLAFQLPIYEWARDHRLHHKHSDTDADPYNARRGFFFSHMGWILVKKHPLVRTRGKTMDLSDLNSDPIVTFQRKYFLPFGLLTCFVIPSVIPWKFWGEDLSTAFLVCGTLRLTIILHSTWLVNSAAHIWGMKPYDKAIDPCENSFVSWFAMGEGWHNYHHTFPWDYRASEFGKMFNLTTTFIDFCAKIGWAYDLKTASESVIDARARRSGDGSRTEHENPILPNNLN